ncbi:MAG: T9SS type A sorting domain-containing protein [Lewinellaceae bacterium]|nr:T9SS type A sorting domain-containing protein [Lewinellaceae bacterium]
MKNFSFTCVLLLSTMVLQAQDFVQSPYQGSRASSYAVGDFDGDGYDDIFGVNIQFNGASDLYLFKNDPGSGSLTFQKELISEGHPGTGDPDAADYDGDGDLDIVLATGAGLDLVVFENDGSGNFTEVALGVSGSRQLKFGDIDGDGDLDIAGIDIPTRTINLFVNDGSQSFTEVNVVTATTSLKAFALGDLDDDGDLDIVAGYDEFSGDQVVLMENDGNNNFGSVVLAAGSGGFRYLSALAIADLNKDGKMDIAGVSSYNFSGWINEGSLSFQQQLLADYSGTSSFGFLSLALADFNGDAIPDAVMGDNDGPIVWYKNTSTNPLEYEKRTVGSVAPGYVFEAADFDKDGDIDIVTSNGDFWWYENVIEQVSAIRLTNAVKLEFFPNPVQNTLRFRHIPMGKYHYELFGPQGRRVLSGIISDVSIEMASLKPGSYFLTVTDAESGARGTAVVIKQ